MIYDVVIVGAGPAGASTAIGLAQRGVRVALLDKARFPRIKPCAEYVNPEALRVLDLLGLSGCVRDAGAAIFRGMRVTSPAGRTLDLDFAADAGRQALGISRYALDRLAVERCRSLGVEVFEGARVRALMAGRGPTGTVSANRGGTTIELRGRVIVGADGHHSTVARRLGLATLWRMRWARCTSGRTATAGSRRKRTGW
jgi:flavin-dependent dehydrogenase